MNHRLLAWLQDLKDRWLYTRHRRRQRAQARKNARNDRNVYPLW